ncbi:MAG: FAD-dependent oxidoreductase, partial [Thermomicrobiaceae bacterium]|nr:FAD-dependent oxidoreductase [Thermomicrobiaceae bacterium]
MERDLRRLASEAFDLVVVGGGIHGAWIAWDAALRGLSVALVERGDFAGGASSNSLKIVHGGLRYLQSADLKRVRESIRERSVLLRVAPHLVRPLPFVIPLYGHGTRGPEALRVALALADLAGIDRNRGLDDDHLLPRGRVLSVAECLRYLPDIDRRGLRGGALWYDAQMRSDARIVLAVLRSAAERGAALANYVEAREVVVRDGRVAAVRVRDRLEGAEFEVRARVVALACGAWGQALLARAGAPAPPLLLSKAMNLAVPRLFGEWGAGVPLRGPGVSGRMLFATPWRDHTLIGTAHLPYHGPAEGFEPSWRDVED